MEKMISFFDNLAESWSHHRTNKDIERIYEMMDKMPIEKGDLVLDVACGTGVVTSYLANKTQNNVLGVDISSEMISYAKRANNNPLVEFKTLNFYEYDSNNKYDKIMIFDAYPHFIERDVLKESLIRNLKKNGMFIICHDLSRKKLDECHSGNQVNKLSRSINAPMEEAKFYLDSFEVVESYEDDNSYLLIMQIK